MSYKMFIYLVMECQLNSAQDLRFTFWPKANYYYEGDHGKDLMDGIGGDKKNAVFKKVKSGHCIIDSPLQFVRYAN